MHFMVEGTPKQSLTDDLLAQLPAESARGQELEAQGLRHVLYVAADFSKAWQIFHADSLDEVQRALESLPLYAVTAYTITPLADDR